MLSLAGASPERHRQEGKTLVQTARLFRQLLQHISRSEFAALGKKHGAGKGAKGFAAVPNWGDEPGRLVPFDAGLCQFTPPGGSVRGCFPDHVGEVPPRTFRLVPSSSPTSPDHPLPRYQAG